MAAELSGAELSRLVWEAKYRAPGEAAVADTWARIAAATAAVEREPGLWRGRFRALLEDFRFLPGGRIQAGAGDPAAVLFNCFVLPAFGPGPGAEADRALDALREAVATLRAGGGVGCDVSGAPPAGAAAERGPPAPGPVGYLHLWDAACRVFLAGATRQGALMGALRCDHPDVEAFAAAKTAPGALSRFNLSVAVTEAFMAAVAADADWPLRFPVETGPVVRTVRARGLWTRILRCAYETGDPGVLFIDRINAENPLAWRERLAATNPCGEVPLPDYGACDLGSLNLTRFVAAPFTPEARLDLAGLAEAAAAAVRLLDDVIDISAFPLAAQADEARATRRIGLGITGLADALVMLGLRYGEAASLRAAGEAMRTIRDAAYGASAGLAREKGAFPACEAERLLAGPFARRLPEPLRAAIARHGLRNSHLLAVAPAGSISLLAGGISPGLEPIFAAVQERTLRTSPGETRAVRWTAASVALWRRATGEAAGLPPAFAAAHDIPADAHLDMQAALQPYVDQAISKTVNVPVETPFEDFARIYAGAHARGLKGCTAFRPARAQVIAAAPGGCPG
ncbi:ribonucleoside-diphosphate reductase alpha chain [Phenylobacterium zucineum HLK1]|uniref:Vitamin B12-dependent ribonucleotide reductase n=1 Tax=Phenylobacterium zucineum (strain HLK1) TaxID=450851 RepID=B4RFH2_PHEZH|nr:adenosylcobalamin-dependent ribonucleoside-diphosphate reductase [Phenylobacterium zucineum]ACG77053.1 ribonucleoside-diphosphate reductase alpha chain [Phenylobacterium zucineum HLK1]